MICRTTILVAAILTGLPSWSAAQAANQANQSAERKSSTPNVLYWLLQTAAEGVVQGIAGEVASDVYRYFFPTNANGQVDTSEIRRTLAILEERDQANAAAIRELQAGLRDRMTRDEVRALLHQALTKVDQKLADLARKVEDQQTTLATHRRLLDRMDYDVLQLFQGQKNLSERLEAARVEAQRRVDALRREVGQELTDQSGRITRVESEMESLRKDYPRWQPGEQGEQLGVAGYQFLLKGENREAIRALRFAHGYEPTEPCYLYLLAVAHRRLGSKEEAELYLTRGVAAERKRPLTYSRLWKNIAERFQGADRLWLESSRADAIYGVYVPGTIHLP